MNKLTSGGGEDPDLNLWIFFNVDPTLAAPQADHLQP